MDSLLKHMVDMTGHRDHAMLDISVMSAVRELANAAETRVLTLCSVRGQLCVRPRAVIHAGEALHLLENPESAGPDEPINQYPALAACLAQHLPSAELVGADGRRTVWLPIWLGDKANTCLEIVDPTPYSSATLQVIGGIISVYRNFQTLLDYSERDSLTGLLNRKTFELQLAKMLQAGSEAPPERDGEERRQAPVDPIAAAPAPDDGPQVHRQWLAVIDVDHFKAVNDKFGHLYGDEVLILIANLMQTSFRAEDKVFRFGGEEFVVLLRSSTLENAKKVIDRFRNTVASHDFPQVGRVTVSVGFVSISAYEAPVIILGRADQALYYAKSHGRNVAFHYDELVSGGLLQTIASNDTAEFF